MSMNNRVVNTIVNFNFSNIIIAALVCYTLLVFQPTIEHWIDSHYDNPSCEVG